MYLTPQDLAEIRQIVACQLSALQRDDHVTAFACASLFIQEQFGTPQKFMEMVQSAYQPVYRPRSVVFEEVIALENIPTQQVLILTENDQLVRAYYLMHRQAGGSSRVDLQACKLGTGRRFTTS
jgi:hypothetical protein